MVRASGPLDVNAAELRILADVTHGLGLNYAHAMMRNRALYVDGDVVSTALDVADSFDEVGEPDAGDVIRAIIARDSGALLPAIELDAGDVAELEEHPTRAPASDP